MKNAPNSEKPEARFNTANTIKPGTKEHALCEALKHRSLNRFEAAKDFGDWCLNSTVATLSAKGVRIARRWETIPGRTGKPVRVLRYWIPQADAEG